jgi:hypothetical protein
MSAGLGRNHLDCRIAQVNNGQIRNGPCEARNRGVARKLLSFSLCSGIVQKSRCSNNTRTWRTMVKLHP